MQFTTWSSLFSVTILLPSLPSFVYLGEESTSLYLPRSMSISTYCALVCTRYSFYYLAVLSAVQSKRMKWCSCSLSFILRQYKTPYWKVDKLWNSPWYSGLRQQSMDKQSAHHRGAGWPGPASTTFWNRKAETEEFSNWMCLSWAMMPWGERGTPINMLFKEKNKRLQPS